MVEFNKTIIKSIKHNTSITIDDVILNINKKDIVNIKHRATEHGDPFIINGYVTRIEHHIDKKYGSKSIEHTCIIYVY